MDSTLEKLLEMGIGEYQLVNAAVFTRVPGGWIVQPMSGGGDGAAFVPVPAALTPATANHVLSADDLALPTPPPTEGE